MGRAAQILRRNANGSSTGIRALGDLIEEPNGAWVFVTTIGPAWIPAAGERLEVVIEDGRRRAEATFERRERGVDPRTCTMRLVGISPLQSASVGYDARPTDAESP